MHSPDSTPTYTRHPDVLFRRDDQATSGDAGILYHPGNDRAFALNPTGVLVWHELDQPRTRDALAERVLAHFDRPPANAADTVTRFLNNLLDRGLVIRHG